MLIDLIVGARPNFMKIAPITEALDNKKMSGQNIDYRLVHTGQHYDENMSDFFFEQLRIPKPDINLGAGSGTQAEQTASIMIGYERLLLNAPSNLCLVVGDVTSTMACSITAQKLHIPVAHVEAGIRSGDWKMPEEINRLVTDAVTNYYFTTSSVANANLKKAGVENERIFFVGNVMIDTLLKHRPNFKKPIIWDKIGLKEKSYIIITLHRPSNVDTLNILRSIMEEIIAHSKDLYLVFPVHPRTAQKMKNLGISNKRLQLIDPLGYLEFNYLVERSKAVITDSGGITEETTVMGIPCMTLRKSTERPETIDIGTNELLGANPKAIGPAFKKLFSGKWKEGKIPELWDGKSAERIVKHLLEVLN